MPHRVDERWAEHLLEDASDAIIAIDESQRLIFFNRRAEQVFGLSAEEALGSSLQRLLPIDVEANHRDFVNSFARGEHRRLRLGGARALEGRRADGTYFPAEISVSRTERDGRAVMTAIIRDLTERRQVEQLLRAVSETASAAEHGDAISALAGALERSLEVAAAFVAVHHGDGAGWEVTFADGRTRRVMPAEGERNLLCATAGIGEVHCEGDRSERFPGDARWSPPGEYASTCAIRDGGHLVGVLGVIDERPLVADAVLLPVLRLQGLRVASEVGRRAAEERLRRQRFLYRKCLGESRVAICLWDRDVLREHNPAAEGLFPGASTVLGGNVQQLFGGEPAVLAAYRRAQQSQGAISEKVTLGNHDVELRLVAAEDTVVMFADGLGTEADCSAVATMERAPFPQALWRQAAGGVECQGLNSLARELLGDAAEDLFEDSERLPGLQPELSALLRKADGVSREIMVRRRGRPDLRLRARAAWSGPWLHLDLERLASQGAVSKASEAELEQRATRLAQSLLKEAARSVPVGIFQADRDGNVLYANPAWRTMAGSTMNDALGFGWLDAVAVEDRDRVRGQWSSAVRSHAAFRSELRFHRQKDGASTWVLAEAVPERDVDGSVRGWLGTFTNISALRKAQVELRRAERHLGAAQRVASLGSWYWSKSQGAMSWTDEVYRVLGVAELDAPSLETLLARIFPEDRADFEAALVRLRATGVGSSLRHRVQRPNGEVRWVQSRLEATDDGLGLIGTVHDITHQHELEQRLHQGQRLESLGRLAGGIAHDFNNVLSVVLSSAYIIGEESGEHLSEDVASIQDAATRGARLTRQLLAFSRRQVLRPRATRIDEVVRDLESMLRRLVGEDVSLAFELEVVPPILIDVGQLEQVIVNLAVNARDAMPRGGALTFEVAAADGDRVALRVRDSGAGISDEVLPHIFEPFFTTKAEGTGLGLATVYGVVQQSSGTVDVRSRPGEGTEFQLFFPVEGQGDAPKSVPPPRVLRAPRCENRTVLVAEDEPGLGRAIARILRSAGYEVCLAGDGHEALAQIEDGLRVDVLLTDVVMPGMSGVELAERVLRRRPQVKLLFMSGYPAETTGRHGLEVDAAHFMGKPFSPEELLRNLEALFDAPEPELLSLRP